MIFPIIKGVFIVLHSPYTKKRLKEIKISLAGICPKQESKAQRKVRNESDPLIPFD